MNSVRSTATVNLLERAVDAREMSFEAARPAAAI
jgi:hypothetical protein